MSRPVAAAAAFVVSFGLAGCLISTTMSPRERQKYIAAHPEITPEVRSAIAAGGLCLGMTEEEVVASIGIPDDVNRSTYSFGTTCQFCYGLPGMQYVQYKYKYVYFENGRVTSWQQ